MLVQTKLRFVFQPTPTNTATQDDSSQTPEITVRIVFPNAGNLLQNRIQKMGCKRRVHSCTALQDRPHDHSAYPNLIRPIWMSCMSCRQGYITPRSVTVTVHLDHGIVLHTRLGLQWLVCDEDWDETLTCTGVRSQRPHAHAERPRLSLTLAFLNSHQSRTSQVQQRC